MHPVLIHIGDFELATYGFMAALSWFTCLVVLVIVGKRQGEDPWFVFEVLIGTAMSGVIGARLMYVLQHIDRYADNPMRALNLNDGGLVFLPGFFSAVLFIYLWSRRGGRDGIAYLDMLAPAAALSMGVARWGCFGAGCCYGRVAEGLPWAVTFSSELSRAPLGIPLHPTQVYLAVGNLLLAAYLIWLVEHKKWRGQVIVHYLVIYALFRSVVEMFRGDSVRGYIVELNFWGDQTPEILSTSQGLSILMVVIAVVFVAYQRKKRSSDS